MFPLLTLLAALLFPAGRSLAQQATTEPPAATPLKNSPEFLATADDVLHEMSQITGWELKTPLKKSLRSREEIRAYVIRQMNEEKNEQERYAATRSAEAFGLIPKGFNLENFLVELLTEQIAGLYDPKSHEFYIADWIPLDEQRTVMAHELTHALEDQHFQIEDWVRAARPNDDAELARQSVLEGSAMAAMIEYMLKAKGLKVRDLPDVDPSLLVGDLNQSPQLKAAPPFIRDSLLFPYFSGLTFSIFLLKTDGWSGFGTVFEHPPANTQQIMHPQLYRSNIVPAPLKLDIPASPTANGWRVLEENSMGEFGWGEILKQYLESKRAKTLANAWDGDVYATFESKDKTQVLLMARVRFASIEEAESFFTEYSELLDKKYPTRSSAFRDGKYYTFATPGGSAFLRCQQKQCAIIEGGDLTLYQQWIRNLGWGNAPEGAKAAAGAASSSGLAEPAAHSGGLD